MKGLFGKKKGKGRFHVEQKVECEWCGDIVPKSEASRTDEGYACNECMERRLSRE